VINGPIHKERQRLHGPKMETLAQWIVRSAAAGERADVITTNYDVALERAIYHRLDKQRAGRREDAVDYGFSWRTQHNGELVHRPRASVTSLLKLHGAVNWLRCALCGYTYIAEYGALFQYAAAEIGDDVNTCHCGYSPLEYVMVAPSGVRDPRDVNVRSTWQAALETLRLAGRWVILGYSLPEEDTAIRSLFVRASRARSHQPQVDVFELNEAVGGRFEIMLTSVKFHGAGIEDFISEILGPPNSPQKPTSR